MPVMTSQDSTTKTDQRLVEMPEMDDIIELAKSHQEEIGRFRCTRQD